MYKQILVVFFIMFGYGSIAQSGQSLVETLTSINKKVAALPCRSSQAQLISNRGMNIFLADKTGYLSSFGDLSYYTNYVTLNSSNGLLTINHNFQEAKGTDEPLKALFSVGVKANVADGFNASWLEKRLKNSLGVTLTQTWLGKVKTRIQGCDVPVATTENIHFAGNQKQAMDAMRLSIVKQLEAEINDKITTFEAAIESIDSIEEIPGQSHAARNLVRRDFYAELYEDYQERFAQLQAEILTRTGYYKVIRTQWTSLSAYIPLAFAKYQVAANLSTPIQQKHPYPLQLSLSHTRFWQSSKAGRIFVTVLGNLHFNNSVNAWLTDDITIGRYKQLGGTDTIRLANLHQPDIQIGAYKTFITPNVQGRLVYFPGASHVGISLFAEKNFGDYHLVNGRIGIPVVLINRKKVPALNIEFQVQFFDLTNVINEKDKHGNKKTVGVNIGFPLSRLMY